MVATFDIAHFRVWLATEMRARGISQRMLGQRSGVHRSTVSRLLRTGRAPTTETMMALAAALGAELPAYLAPASTSGPLEPRIRQALTGFGIDPTVADDMVAVYRRSRFVSTSRDETG